VVELVDSEIAVLVEAEFTAKFWAKVPDEG
jgi:hypothetical protein